MPAENFSAPTGASSRQFFTITPHATNELAYYTRAIYVGGTGDIAMINARGETVIFRAVPAGQVLPVTTVRVLATGTTATNLVGMA